MEHDGCNRCKFEKVAFSDKPCVNCKGTVSPIDPEYENRPDLYESIDNVVSHPSHYCYSDYEPKDVIRGWGLNFNLGNVIKYVVRAGRKDDILQELNKAKQYLEFEIEAIEKERGLS